MLLGFKEIFFSEKATFNTLCSSRVLVYVVYIRQCMQLGSESSSTWHG